jgi:hypothetical protein
MAQTTSFEIDNGTGAEVRTSLNNALMALATTNTGATAPVTPLFGMLWVDTSTATLKIYAGDDVWLIIIDSVAATSTSGASATFASGTKMVFHQVTVPAGWQQDSINEAALRVVSGTAGGATGSDNFSSWVQNPMLGWGSSTQPIVGSGDAIATFLIATSSVPDLKYVDVMICTKD